jgi:hypothetical protein
VILSTRASVSIADHYFDEPSSGPTADIVRHNYFSCPQPGMSTRSSSTILIDLAQSTEELLAQMKSLSRRQIRHSPNPAFSLSFLHTPTLADVTRFCQFHLECNRLKGLQPISAQRVQILAQNGVLQLSFATATSDGLLAAHGYVVVNGRARLLYNACSFRAPSDPAIGKLIGSINRILLWYDMLEFKNRGLRWFDLGGWYEGQRDLEKLKINFFKESMGGRIVKEFSSVRAATLKGKVALLVINSRVLLGRFVLARRELVRRLSLIGSRLTPHQV